ncbi:MAG: restriction endonuclease subunit S, partial [Thaumarchaeota archaeon]|nr:restriction endonuclease subunit S [Nitrososphaerota archaeon]
MRAGRQHSRPGRRARPFPKGAPKAAQKRLGSVVLLETGSRPRGGVSKYSTGVPSVGAEHLTAGGRFDFSKVKYVPERFYASMGRGRIRAGDILLVKDGATIGNVSLVTPAFPFERACANEHVFILRPKSPGLLRPGYLFYFLSTPGAQARIRQRISGSAQGGLTQRSLSSLAIAVPHPREQGRIASILSNVDALMENTEGAIESYGRLKSHLVRSLIKPARAARNPAGGHGKGWRGCTLSSIGKIVGGGTPDTKNPDYWNGDIPWATPTDVTGIGSNFILKTRRSITKKGLGKSAARLLPKHSILISTRATIGEVAVNAVPMATNQGFH